MKKFLIALFVLAGLLTVKAQEELTLATLLAQTSVTTTNTSTNYSFGVIYSAAGVAQNAAFPVEGKVLFVGQAGAAGTNNVVFRLQDSSDNTNYTTQATWVVTTNTPASLVYDVRTLNRYWRVQAVSTNGSPIVNVNALYKKKNI